MSPSSDPVVGPVSEIAETIHGKIAPSESFRRSARDMVEDIEKALPPAARGVFGASEEARDEILDELIRDGCEAVLAHLHQTREEVVD